MHSRDPQDPQSPVGHAPRWGRLSVHTSHSPFAWLAFFVSTSVEVNGQVQKHPWGTSTYDLQEGVHHIKVYFNYLFGPAGVGTSEVQIYAGYNSHISYRPPVFIFSSANLIENERQPIRQLPPG